MRKSMIPTVLAAALVCSPLAFAATNPPAATNAGTSAATSRTGQHHGRHAWRTMGMLDQLDLTDTQRTSIMQALRQKKLAFESATPGSSAYQTATDDLAQAESNAARARVLRQAELHTKIYNELTPAQRTKLASIRSQREAKIKQWRESHVRSANAPATSSR